MILPILLSVPHAGWKIPPEVQNICLLTEKDIRDDGDGGASEIYYPLEKEVHAFVTTEIARAIVDMNRAENDFRKDGIIKTHTCWDVPVYSEYPTKETIGKMLAQYHRPYHAQLSAFAKTVKVGIDCHTMAAVAPPVAPDSGKERPPVCLSNGDFTCPKEWIQSLAEMLSHTLDHPVSINRPFKGGYIIRSHAQEIPWIQVEFSRAPFLSHEQKSRRLLDALKRWTAQIM